jgi:hypothetical protein
VFQSALAAIVAGIASLSLVPQTTAARDQSSISSFEHIAGIQPLTTESMQQATAWDLQNDSRLNFPHFVQMALLDRPDRLEERSALLTKIQTMPFTVQLLSPFYRVATAVSEAKRKFQESPAFSLDEVNAGLVVVRVGPGVNFGTAGTVENVIIKRGVTAHRPVKQSVRPTTLTNRMGASKPSSEGEFVFPFDTFSPTAPGEFVIVVIGADANFEIPMTSSELARLR